MGRSPPFSAHRKTWSFYLQTIRKLPDLTITCFKFKKVFTLFSSAIALPRFIEVLTCFDSSGFAFPTRGPFSSVKVVNISDKIKVPLVNRQKFQKTQMHNSTVSYELYLIRWKESLEIFTTIKISLFSFESELHISNALNRSWKIRSSLL